MELEFEVIDKQTVAVIAIKDGERKKVGEIFTPSGSGHRITNAIQICGFSEAFDLWGCAVFGQLKDKEKVVARIETREPEYVQVKDIQLKFDWETEPHRENWKNHCIRCYNTPCTCENGKKLDLSLNDLLEGKGKSVECPYTIKREEDVEGLEHKKEDKNE